MITLFYAPQTRAGRARWTLEELGVPYELVRLDMAEGEHKSEEYLELHPLGLVPALQDDDQVIIESAAICLYLADRFPEKQLAPPLAQRGLYYQWCVYTLASLEEPLVQVFNNTVRLPPAQRSLMSEAVGREKAREVIAPIEAILARQEFILTSGFSVADILLGGALSWAGRMGVLNRYLACQAYSQRLKARPAYLRSIAD